MGAVEYIILSIRVLYVVLPQGLLREVSIDNTRNCHLCHVKLILRGFNLKTLEN